MNELSNYLKNQENLYNLMEEWIKNSENINQNLQNQKVLFNKKSDKFYLFLLIRLNSSKRRTIPPITKFLIPVIFNFTRKSIKIVNFLDQNKIYKKNQRRLDQLKNFLKEDPENMTPDYDSDIEIDENKLEISEKYDIMYI